MSVPITPLDPWISGFIEREFPHLRKDKTRGRIGSRVEIDNVQAVLLDRLISHAASRSPFYMERLRGYERVPFSELPFTFPTDLADQASRFLAVSQSMIRRVVTIGTSGTSSLPKRLFFADEDLKATEEFFLHGMSTFTPRGSIVAVFMEGSSPHSIGWILRSALGRMGCETLVFGLIDDPLEAASRIDEHRPEVIVGLPAQLAQVAGRTLHRPDFVLLSADMATPSIRRRIERRWKCASFDHYGLTESGWGCAVECRTREGCHVREMDVLVEVVDPNGKILPEGEWGEIVITMLRRASSPLIRYRTGDEGRILPGRCRCGSPLKRIEVLGRLPRKGAGGVPLRLHDVENSLWDLPLVDDFRLSLECDGDAPEALVLTLAMTDHSEGILESVLQSLGKIPGIPEKITVKIEAVGALSHGRPKRDWNN